MTCEKKIQITAEKAVEILRANPRMKYKDAIKKAKEVLGYENNLQECKR